MIRTTSATTSIKVDTMDRRPVQIGASLGNHGDTFRLAIYVTMNCNSRAILLPSFGGLLDTRRDSLQLGTFLVRLEDIHHRILVQLLDILPVGTRLPRRAQFCMS